MNIAILSSEEFLDYLSWDMLYLSKCNPREVATKIQQCCDESFMDGDTEGYSRGEKEAEDSAEDAYLVLEIKHRKLEEAHLELKADLELCIRSAEVLKNF